MYQPKEAITLNSSKIVNLCRSPQNKIEFQFENDLITMKKDGTTTTIDLSNECSAQVCNTTCKVTFTLVILIKKQIEKAHNMYEVTLPC